MTDDVRLFAAVALGDIADWWEELEEDLLPGTSRRWYQREETAEQLADRAEQDRQDRLAKQLEIWKGRTPNGFTASPVTDQVLDVKVDVESTVAKLWLLVHDRTGSVTSIERQPVPVMARWLADCLPGMDDADLVELLGRESRRCAAAMVRATGRTEPVLKLDGRCPDCRCLSLRAWPLKETAKCVTPSCGRVWAGQEQLAWLSRIIGGPADPLAVVP